MARHKVKTQALVTAKEELSKWLPFVTDMEARVRIEEAVAHFGELLSAHAEVNYNRNMSRQLLKLLDERSELPCDYYFAIRHGGHTEYMLYLSLKWKWFACNQRFPWNGIGLRNAQVRQAIEGNREHDSGLYWFVGLPDTMEAHRQTLLAIGMEEKPVILDTLHRYPEDREPEAGDLTCE